MSTGTQLPLWDDPPQDVFWCIPVDRYGRDLPPIAMAGGDWKGAYTWGYHAAEAAGELGPEATPGELYEATTGARHLFYALTGDREKLTLELAQMGAGDLPEPGELKP